MTGREEFEKYMAYNFDLATPLEKALARCVWKARQSEIDALKHENVMQADHIERLLGDMDLLKAEVSELKLRLIRRYRSESEPNFALSAAKDIPEGWQFKPVQYSKDFMERLEAELKYQTSLKVQRDHVANERIGSWLSAALDDPNVCEAMKADIRAWFGERL